MSRDLKCTWEAIHNFMPPHPAKLIVTGECPVPTPGYTVTLTETIPPGINPAYLLLDMKVKGPTGIEPQHVTTVKTIFEKVTDHRYEYITILPDHIDIPIKEIA